MSGMFEGFQARDVETAKATTADSQRRYDSARGVIEKIYESRQR